MTKFRRLMQKADLTSRAIAGFVDFLLVIGLSRLPDVLGFLSASGYLLIRDGLFQGQSLGKKLIDLNVVTDDAPNNAATYRESLIRNSPLVAAYILFLIPYIGWILGLMAIGVECLVALGDERGMRIGDMLARTRVVQRHRAGAGKGPEQPPEPSAQQDETERHP
jgi:uncharacterized RDD family membrane protein YckC